MKWMFHKKKQEPNTPFILGANYWDAWITINDSKQDDPTWPAIYRRIADENLNPNGKNSWEDLFKFLKKLAEAAKE